MPMRVRTGVRSACRSSCVLLMVILAGSIRERTLKVCEICEETEACVEVKRYEDGELRELSLCSACAQKHGLALPENLADLLLESTLEKVASSAKGSAGASDGTRRCPACQLRLADFRKTGRLGCPGCYTAWEDVLEPMLLGMHRSLVYQGAAPAGNALDSESLQQALLEAVAREDYEEAARLRDRIQRVPRADNEKQGEFLFDESR